MLRTHELAQLQALPLFSGMTAQSLEGLLDAALLQQFPSGVTLIREGEPADFLHVLVDGLVEIYTEQAGGDCVVLGRADRDGTEGAVSDDQLRCVLRRLAGRF